MFIHVDIFELSLSRFRPRECEHRILHVKLYTDNKVDKTIHIDICVLYMLVTFEICLRVPIVKPL